jgi:arylsulfatase A-like enzyme
LARSKASLLTYGLPSPVRSEVRRLEVYLRVALLVAVLVTAANVVYGLIRFHHESPRLGDLATATFHAFSLTLLPALVLAAFAALVVGLAGLLPFGKWLGRFSRAPSFTPDPPTVARAYAGLATLTAFVVVTQLLALHFATRYHDQWLASSALAASLAGVVLALLFVWDVLLALLEATFQKLKFLAVPAGFHLVWIALVVLAVVGFARTSPALLHAYHPADLAFGPASAAAFALFAWLYERKKAPLRGWVTPAIVTLSLVCIVTSSLVYGNRYRHRIWVEERFVIVKRLYRLATVLTDRDGDGHSQLFGGEDCDDRDPTIHPGAADPPGDGIDSDCFAGDGGPEISSMSTGHFTKSPLVAMRPNILFITVDALRPDHLGCFGYERDTSPAIDALCEKSTRFHEAIAQSSRSIRSIPSMFTGFAPSQIAYGSEYLFPALLPENVMLAEVLAPHYQTAAVLGTNYFQRFEGLDQGFQRFRQDTAYLPPRHVVTDRAIEELRRMRQEDRPYFLWAYFFNVHEPYLQDGVPSKFGEGRMAGYDTEITLVDAEIARLLALERQLEFKRPTVIILHSDHGEAFWERGLIGHSHNVNREEIRSTLLIHVPGVEGRDVHVPVPLSDLMPTVANLANIPLEHEIPARSLVPLLTADPGPEFVDRLIFSEVLPDGHYPWDEKMIQRGTDKLIYDTRSGRVQLFDHSTDPFEHEDLSDDRPELVSELLGLLRSWIAETHRPEQRDDLVVESNRLDALPEEMTHPLDVTFGGFLRIAGLDLNKTAFRRGDRIEMDFYYEVLGETSKDLFFYVEVKDSEGRELRHDFHARHYPMNGRYRTNRFRKGELLRDPVRLVIPRNVRPAGEVTLTLTLADERTPIRYAGAKGSGTTLELARITVK